MCMYWYTNKGESFLALPIGAQLGSSSCYESVLTYMWPSLEYHIIVDSSVEAESFSF